MENEVVIENQINNVVDAFEKFLLSYNLYRRMADLNNKKIENVHEILTGMTDKHGRICRYIKHQERKDSKSDWPQGMTQGATGYLVYLILLLDHYNLKIKDGMISELKEAIKQYGSRI